MNKILACIDTRGKTDAVIDWAASAHLQSLKGARLVQSRRDGKRIVYRLSGPDVAQLGVRLRQVAEEHLVELRLAPQKMMDQPDRLTRLDRKELMAQARRGEVVVLDVRPSEEFDAAQLSNLTAVDRYTSYEVVYHLQSLDLNHQVVVKAIVADHEAPSLPSAYPVYKGALLQEREVYDLMGTRSPGHQGI